VNAARPGSGFWSAVTFLTTLPAPSAALPPEGLGRAAVWFPAVGVVIGVLLWGVRWLGDQLFDPWLAGALVVTAWAVLTGGLHLDGLADCCDGLLAPVGRERRLEILRDPRLGSFGALGLGLFLLLKTLATAHAAHAALLIAPAWARWALLVAARQPQARPGGMGASFAAGMTPGVLAAAALLPLLLGGLAPLRGLVALLVAGGAIWGALRLARARIGGVTGDVYGLVVELCELAVLLVFAARPWG
jgi:adenosylcobinamide-GDP ribazoletransferase